MGQSGLKRCLAAGIAASALLAGSADAAAFMDNHPSKIILGQPSIYPTYKGFPAANGGAGQDARGWTTIAGTGFVYVTDRATFGSEKVLVSDRAQNRVLIWNAVPDTNFKPADVVVGQTDFVTATKGTAADKLYEPMGMTATPAGQLVVAERQNNRVMIWNTFPTTNGAAADVVLGQDNKTSVAAVNVGRNRLAGPEDVAAWGTALAVADRENSRIMIWRDITAGKVADGQNADVVLGQSNFDERFNDKIIPFPRSVAFGPAGQIVSATQGPHIIAIWNSIPTVDSGAPPDITIDLGEDARGVSVGRDGRLAAAAASGAKVFLWDKFPTMKDQAPDHVIVPNGNNTRGFNSAISGAIDVSWNADGNLYVSHGGGLGVSILDPAVTTIPPWPPAVAFRDTDIWAVGGVMFSLIDRMSAVGVSPYEWAQLPEGSASGVLSRTDGSYTPVITNPNDLQSQVRDVIRVRDGIGDEAKISIRACPAVSIYNTSGNSTVYAGVGVGLNGGGGASGSVYGAPWTWRFVQNNSGGTLTKPDYGYSYQINYTPGPTTGVKDVIVCTDMYGMSSPPTEFTVQQRLRSAVASKSFYPTEPFQTLTLKVGETVQFTASGGSGSGYRWGNYNNYYIYGGKAYGNGTVDPNTGSYTAKRAGSDAVYVNDSASNAFTVNITINP